LAYLITGNSNPFTERQYTYLKVTD